jgi:6-phosphogluconolactonase
MAREIKILKDAAALAEEGTRRFVKIATEAVAERGRFIAALSGGSTPRAMNALLSAPQFKSQVPWANTYLFFGDERFVPPEHPDSNYLMAKESLLKNVAIPENNVFRVQTEGCSPEEAARAYASSLITATGSSQPCLDLILLGMGPDGHTASLFPNSPVLDSQDLVSAVYNSPKPPPVRVTFTYSLINNAREVVFLIAGPDKAPVVRKALEDNVSYKQVPACGIKPKNGTLQWLIDEKACQELKSAAK